MTQQITIDPNDVVIEGNPRTTINDESFRSFVENIRELGITQPVTVRQSGENGKTVTTLVSGQRRILAARELKLSEVPALVVEADDERAHAMSVSENIHRDPLTPMEEAKAFKVASDRMAPAQIARAYSVSETLVQERLQLNSLPESLHASVDDRSLPLPAARNIAKIAAHSPELGEAVAYALLETDRVGISHFVSNFQYGIAGAVEAFAEKKKGGKSLFAHGVTSRTVSEQSLAAITAINKDAGKAIGKLQEKFSVYGDYSEILTPEMVDAARVYGALLELETPHGDTSQFVTDPVWFVEHSMGRIEEKAAKGEEAAKRETARSAGTRGGPKVADLSDELKAARVKEQEKAKKRKQLAISENEELGAKLMTRLPAKFDQRTLRLLGIVIFAKLGELAGRGIRYVVPELRSVEETKSGTKVTYASATEASDWWEKRFERLKKPEEMLHHILLLFAAAEFADQEAVAQSSRSFGDVPTDEASGILYAMTKALLPTQIAKDAAANEKKRSKTPSRRPRAANADT